MAIHGYIDTRNFASFQEPFLEILPLPRNHLQKVVLFPHTLSGNRSSSKKPFPETVPLSRKLFQNVFLFPETLSGKCS